MYKQYTHKYNTLIFIHVGKLNTCTVFFTIIIKIFLVHTVDSHGGHAD